MSPGNDERRPGGGSGVSVESRRLEDSTSIAPTPADCIDGAQQADENSDRWWRDGAYRKLVMLATSGRIFTADHLLDGLPEPDQPCCVGGLFMAASKSGLIECVGATPSRRASRHGGLVRMWRGTVGVRGGDR